jgi:hypothetical protein
MNVHQELILQLLNKEQDDNLVRVRHVLEEIARYEKRECEIQAAIEWVKAQPWY